MLTTEAEDVDMKEAGNRRRRGKEDPAEHPAKGARVEASGIQHRLKVQEGEDLPARRRQKQEEEPRKVVTESFKKQKALMTLILKSILQQQQQARDVMGILFLVFVIPIDDPLIKPVKQQGAAYARLTKQKGHGLGPPHLYQYGAMVDYFATKLEGSKTQVSLSLWLKDHHKQYGKATLDERQETIAFFRMTEVYGAEKMKLVLSWSPTSRGQEAREKFRSAFALEEAWEGKVGRPPANYLERQLGKWLEEFMK